MNEGVVERERLVHGELPATHADDADPPCEQCLMARRTWRGSVTHPRARRWRNPSYRRRPAGPGKDTTALARAHLWSHPVKVCLCPASTRAKDRRTFGWRATPPVGFGQKIQCLVMMASSRLQRRTPSRAASRMSRVVVLILVGIVGVAARNTAASVMKVVP